MLVISRTIALPHSKGNLIVSQKDVTPSSSSQLVIIITYNLMPSGVGMDCQQQDETFQEEEEENWAQAWEQEEEMSGQNTRGTHGTGTSTSARDSSVPTLPGEAVQATSKTVSAGTHILYSKCGNYPEEDRRKLGFNLQYRKCWL